MTLSKFGYIKTNKEKPKILYCKKIYFIPRLMGKSVNLAFDIEKNKIIDRWYINEYLQNFTLKKIFHLRLIYLKPILIKFFRKLYFKFNNKIKIELSKKDILILGPYSDNHFHILNDFILRIFLLDDKKIQKIYLPISCKQYVKSLKLDKNLKFKFFFLKNNRNYQFYNAQYLTHLESRIKNNSYISCVKKLQKIVKIKKSKKKFNILVSRENNSRKIINEKNLFKELINKKFIKLNFEKLSLNKQIFYCFNSNFIIGYHGSGIMNPILFNNNQTKIIEILHDDYNHKMYQKITSFLGVKYKSFICHGVSKNLDCFCNVREIINYLDNNFRLN